MATNTSRKYKSSIWQALTLYGVYTINNFKTFIHSYSTEKIQYSFPKVSRSWTKDAKSLFSPGVLGKISDYFQTFLFMKAHLQSQQQLCTTEA